MKILIYILAFLSAYAVNADMSKESLEEFSKNVKPILKKFCIDCHGPKKEKGKIRLDNLTPNMFDERASEIWHDTLNLMNTGEMPPEEEPQPSLQELDTVTAWLTKQLKFATLAKKKLAGNPIRRLTKYEYQNTMESLLGVRMDYSSELPPEGLSPDGFKNNGSSMQMSPLQLELYLKSARKALDRTIVVGSRPVPYKYSTDRSNSKNQNSINRETRRVSSDNRITPGELFGVHMLDHPIKGPFKITIKTKVKMVEGHGPPRMRVMLGFKPDVTMTESAVYKDFDVNEEGTYEFNGYLEDFNMPNSNKGKFPGLLISVFNVYDDGNLSFEFVKKADNQKKKKGKKKKGKKKKEVILMPDKKVAITPQPELIIESVSFESPYYASWPPVYHKEILPDSALRGSNETAYVTKVLKEFMRRAYRRQVTDKDLQWVITYYKKIRGDYNNLELALREILSMVLSSPEFLYRFELSSNKGLVNGDELASRLSYFLWSSMPDSELFTLAKKGKLSDPKVLDSQIERMLKDKKSWNFIDNFSTQWLDLDGIDRIAVNPQFYPKFDNTLKVDIREEAKHFFAAILQKDLSALNFLDSDFIVVNNRLSRFYGKKNGNVSGDFKIVKLTPDSHRGGLLTQAGMLLTNSTGDDSHPIKRAVWLRERILHDPPSPPPPDVPTLDQQNEDFHKLPRKEQLKVHREVQACVRCHRGIDPWGIPFEEFDGVGLYRTKAIRGEGKEKFSVSIDTSSELPGGVNVSGTAELKEYLVKNRREQFAHALAYKVLSYAIGRTLDITEEETVNKITDKFRESGYLLKPLIKAVINSDPFNIK